ncbi:MAG: NAD(P)-dependent oxidoreductase, partial [Acidimicrobiia bacterium]|nr:NAD(P)-dependent oxidoreductase [Acidimicrobiia bacterium]
MNHKPNTLPTIGLIGLGNLGNPMAVSALTNGYKMVVHSLNKNEATNLIALGAQWADTPAEVGASSDVVITVLPTPKHV